jgi:SPP1 gp7 family putative phage head morphogenesis protein
VIASILGGLWAAAWLLGRDSAVQVLGVGGIEEDEAALEALLAAGGDRIPGIVATRVRQLEQALLRALQDGTSVQELAAQITVILGGQQSALLVTQTETSWASAWAQIAAYRAAGITKTIWVTRNDFRVCSKCLRNQNAGPWPLGKPFPTGAIAPPQHPRCRCVLKPAKPDKKGTHPQGTSPGPPPAA